MAIWNDLIDAALTELGIIAPGDVGTTTDRTYCLGVLNRMLSAWSVELGPIFFETTESLSWASGQASRTIGTGGDLSTTRPEKVLGLQYRDASSNDIPLDLFTHQQYQAITNKTLTGLPQAIAYNPTYPLGTLYAWPVPDTTFTLRLTSRKPFAAISDATTTVSLPSGYEAAIVPNLALLLNAYGRDPSPLTEREARKLKAAIVRANVVPQPMSSDYPAGQSGDSIRQWTRP